MQKFSFLYFFSRSNPNAPGLLAKPTVNETCTRAFVPNEQPLSNLELSVLTQFLACLLVSLQHDLEGEGQSCSDLHLPVGSQDAPFVPIW